MSVQNNCLVQNYYHIYSPLGRMGTPDEVRLRLFCFLASNDSSFITGIEFFVDGGTARLGNKFTELVTTNQFSIDVFNLSAFTSSFMLPPIS